MTDMMKQLLARKVERRRQLAALPVGEKLRMLEDMITAAKILSASKSRELQQIVVAGLEKSSFTRCKVQETD
jgi:hypothetical protein